MKAFLMLVFVSAVLIDIHSALTLEERRGVEKKLLEDCNGKENLSVSDEDINSLLDRKLPTDKNAKCMLACAHEAMGMIKDGKFWLDGVRNFASKSYPGDEKAIALAVEIGQECESVTDNDHCELAAKLMECSQNAAIKRGIDPAKGLSTQ